MADGEAELAFLNSMKESTETAETAETADSAESDRPIGTELKEMLSTAESVHVQDSEDPTPSTNADESGNVALALSPSATSSDTARPSPDSIPTAGAVASHVNGHPPSRPASTDSGRRQPSRPVARGGFVVDDDDDDDDDQLLQASLAAYEPPDHISSNPSIAGSLTVTQPDLPSILSSSISTPNEYQAAASPAASADHAGSDALDEAYVPPNAVPSPPEIVPDHSEPAPNPPQVTTPLAGTDVQTDHLKSLPKERLPHDRVGILEDRIKEDPRGDMDAWLNLITEHRKRNKIKEAREVYERYFKVFPAAAEQWVEYANMELAQNDFFHLEQIFSRTLLTIPNLQLWSLYLDYVRRRNNLTTDTTGNARNVVSKAYDFVLDNIGIDKDSGKIWQEYVQFIKSGPGIIGGSNWQDQQKMDLLRKTYSRAICIPTSAVNTLWKEYDSFEMGLNKMTGRKFLQEKSPAYMTARSSATALENITRNVRRTTLPRLPPALGFDGDEDYLQQVDAWKKWISWEKEDPLVLKDEDPVAYKARMVYVYKQAAMALRFWPELWFDASEFCYQNELIKDGDYFITEGMAANPESPLLAFKRADRLEATLTGDEGEEGLKRRGAIVREPYDKVLDALYDLIAKAKAREAQDISRIESEHSPGTYKGVDEEDDEAEKYVREAAKQSQIKIIQDVVGVQIRILSRTISFAWIALMRSMRRIQGKGKIGDGVGGSRQIFTDARKRGRLTSDVYVASALIEYHCYKDPAATKIFERGMKLFPEDAVFALEYLKHLIAINDVTNARAVFETTVSKLAQKPETLHKAKPIYAFFHEYESYYGELSQVSKLEKRMGDLFPEDPQLSRFAHRYISQGFDPTAVRPIVSPAVQTRPKAMLSIESPAPQPASPGRPEQPRNSPKRAAPMDEPENDFNRPRKLARGESPLKGAAGRRLDQQKRNQQNHTNQGQFHRQGQWPLPAPPVPALPRDVLFLLSIIPRADTYYPATRFSPEGMVRLLQTINLPSQLPQGPRSQMPGGRAPQQNGPYSYGR